MMILILPVAVAAVAISAPVVVIAAAVVVVVVKSARLCLTTTNTTATHKRYQQQKQQQQAQQVPVCNRCKRKPYRPCQTNRIASGLWDAWQQCSLPCSITINKSHSRNKTATTTTEPPRMCCTEKHPTIVSSTDHRHHHNHHHHSPPPNHRNRIDRSRNGPNWTPPAWHSNDIANAATMSTHNFWRRRRNGCSSMKVKASVLFPCYPNSWYHNRTNLPPQQQPSIVLQAAFLRNRTRVVLLLVLGWNTRCAGWRKRPTCARFGKP